MLYVSECISLHTDILPLIASMPPQDLKGQVHLNKGPFGQQFNALPVSSIPHRDPITQLVAVSLEQIINAHHLEAVLFLIADDFSVRCHKIVCIFVPQRFL